MVEKIRSIKASAPAKVNLALRVGAPRADGFHPLDTVFEALDIFDDVEAIAVDRAAITMEIHGLGADLPVDERNLVIRAARLLQTECGVESGAHLVVTKRIPVAGGMAGGSADAAATLVALNSLWELNLSSGQLSEFAAQLGSDVPFALLGGIARGTSRGEQLVSVKPREMHGWVVLTNPVGLSTPSVFRKFDELHPDASQLPADTKPMLAALANGGLTDLAQAFQNDLWAPAAALRPDLAQIFAQLERDEIGVGRILSGSGPSIAILCEIAQLDEVARQVRSRFSELGVVSAIGPAAGAHLR